MDKYLKLAIKVAELGENHTRCGCVIVKKGKILSIAFNLIKSHPVQASLNCHRFAQDDSCKHGLHAEINAILRVKVKGKLNGATIYVARLDRYGNTKPAFPCNACLTLIKRYGITSIICT